MLDVHPQVPPLGDPAAQREIGPGRIEHAFLEVEDEELQAGALQVVVAFTRHLLEFVAQL